MWCEITHVEPASHQDHPPLQHMCRDVSEEIPLQQSESHIQGSPQSSALSLTSLIRASPMDLLKRGSPKSKALEKLRAKINQQKLETISSSPVTEMKCQDHMIRKVCRMSSKGL